MGLTVKRIRRLSDPSRYRDDHGLYLQVTLTGVKSWLFRYQHNGVEHWTGLGPLHAFTLEEARERARKARQMLADGIDPLAAKRADRERKRIEESERKAAEASRKTFAECAEQFLAKHSNDWSNAKHRAQWKSTLETYAFPVIGKLFVADIDTPSIVNVLERDALWTTKRVLNFAKTSGYRPGRIVGALEGLAPVQRQRQQRPSRRLALRRAARLPA